MRALTKSLVSLLVAALVAGCSTIKTGYDFDDSVDFTRFRSAAWLTDGVIVAPDSQVVSPLNVKRIRGAVETALAAHGITIVALDEADLEISAIVGARHRVDTTVYPTHSHVHARWDWCDQWCLDARYVERTYTEGTLSVDLFDASNGEPVWHGWARKAVTDADRAHPQTSIEQAVSQMFDEFPPR